MPQRQELPSAVTISLDNPYQAAPFGTPAFITKVSLVVDDNGAPLTQPTALQYGIISHDVDDDLLARLNAKLATMGLRLERLP